MAARTNQVRERDAFDEFDPDGRLVEVQYKPAGPDPRSIEEKYQHLAEDFVELRVRVTSQNLVIAELHARIRALEEQRACL